ncbi:nuclear transport factor 2 family protein [Amycolatopsis minnesotensis]|uniref:Nuclear transport factor 2 family protein n=1 Tax=Amycolatopsis minnesotensis TaxID=337894 RepID=A0ABN2QLY2_9PSEU
METSEVTVRYREAAETGDVDLALSTFAHEAVVRSPLTNRVSFTGHGQLRELLTVAFEHLEDVRFHTDIGDEHTRVVIYRATVRGEDVEEATLLKLEEGLIVEATLFVRTLPGTVAMMDAFGPGIARRNGRPWAARLLSVLSKPLLGMVRGGDRFAVPLAGPKR